MIINDMVLGNLVWAELPPRNLSKIGKLENDSYKNIEKDGIENENETKENIIDQDQDDNDLYRDELCFDNEIQ